MGFFFSTTSKFCSVSCDEVHYEYWYYLKWFNPDDVNNLISCSIYSNKIVHELLRKPRKDFLPQVEILSDTMFLKGKCVELYVCLKLPKNGSSLILVLNHILENDITVLL